MRVALAQINPIIGSFDHNCKKIIDSMNEARKRGALIVIFPEMAILGYPPEDLLCLPSFVDAVEHHLKELIPHSNGLAVIIGCIRRNLDGGEKALYNSAALIQDGELIGYQDKSLLPDYDVFSERRYFEPAKEIKVWNLFGKRVAITICEDIWQHAEAVDDSNYPRDPIEELAKKESVDLLINVSASPFYIGRYETRLNVCQKASGSLKCPLLLCNQVGANDSLIFDGYSLYLNQKGELLRHGQGFKEDLLLIDLDAKVEPISLKPDPTEELFHALVLGVRDYFHKQGLSKACFGLSGGIDSSVVACVAKEALGEENVHALILPSRYSSSESLRDALKLVKKLGIKSTEISIEEPFQSFLNLLQPHFQERESDVTEENLQARIRGILLMAFANKFGYLVLGTGNKSEMAMGYMTLYGDMCGGLGVLNDVIKERVYALARWINQKEEIIPESVLKKAPSAELRADQKDTDTLPEYHIVDLVLKSYVEEHKSPEVISEKHCLPLPLTKELIRKIHCNEYKRRQAPIGLRVTKKAFTIGRRFPIVQHWNM